MGRIDGERRQQREDVRQEIIFEPGFFRLGDVGTVDQDDAGLGERGTQLTPLRLLVLHQKHHGFGDAHQLLRRRQPFRAFGRNTGAHLGAQAGDAHHEEFVEVVGRDRQKPQSLEQRMLAIGGLLKDAAIEVEP